MANIKIRGKLIPSDKTTITDLNYLFEDTTATSKVIQVGEDGRPTFYDVNNYISEQIKQQSELDQKYAEQKAKEEAALAQTAAEEKAAEEALAAKQEAISTAADDATSKTNTALETAKASIKEVSDSLDSVKADLATTNTDLAAEIKRATEEEEGINNSLTEHGTLINKNKEDISALTVDSDKIKAEVFDTTGTGKVSKLEQTAESLTTTLTDLTKDGGRISKVEQTADKINSAVFDGDTNRISTLEQTSSNITTRVGTIETWKDEKAATKEFVNSSIASNTGSLKGNFDVINDLGLTYDSTNSEIAAALLTKITGASTNDYCFVDTKEDETACIKRFKYSGTEWLFEYKLNNSSFTADQWATINSGITSDNVSTLKADHEAIGEWDVSQGTIQGKVGTIDNQIVTITSDTSDLKTKYETQASEISSITATGGAIDLKVSAAKSDLQTEIDTTNNTVTTLSNKVSTNETNIAANKEAIELKASQTDVDNLSGRVTTAEGNITTLQGQISAKAESSEVSDLSTKITTAETNISSLQGEITNKVEQTEYNKTVTTLGEVQTTVTSHTTTLEQTAKDIEAKVNSVSEGNLNVVGWSLKSDGFNITSNNNEVFKVDTSGNLEVSGKVTATSGDIGGCKITDGLLSVPAARISGTLSANQIDAEALKTKKLEIKSSDNIIFYANVDEPNNTQIAGFTVGTDAITSGSGDTSMSIGPEKISLGNGKFIGNKNGNLLVTDAYLGKQTIFNGDAIFLNFSYNETSKTYENYFELNDTEDLVFTFADGSTCTLITADKMYPTTANDYSMSVRETLDGRSEGTYTLYCHREYIKNTAEDQYIGEVVYKCVITANAQSLSKNELCPITVTAIKTDFAANKQYQATKNSYIADNSQILANTESITQESNGIVVANDAISFSTNNKLEPTGVRVIDSNGISQLVSWTSLPGSFGHFVYNDLGNWSCNYTLADTAIKLGDFAKIQLTYNSSNKITSLSNYPIPATLTGYNIKNMFVDTNILKDELFGLFPSTISIYYSSGNTLVIEGKVKGNFGFDSLPILPTAPLIIPLTYSEGFGGYTQTGSIKIPASGEATTITGTVTGFTTTGSTTDTTAGAFYFAVATPKNYGYEYSTTFTGTLGGSAVNFTVAETTLDPTSADINIAQKLLQMFNVKIYSAASEAMSSQGTYTVTLNSAVNYKPTASSTSATAQGTSLELSVVITGGVID